MVSSPTKGRCEMKIQPIKDFPGYLVGDDGTVWTNKSRGFKEKIPNLSYGYKRVSLWKDHKSITIKVHRLILETFKGLPPEEGMECAHINGIRADNRIENLEWVTAKENARQREEHGMTARGARNGRTKLKREQVLEIRELLVEGKSTYQIAKQFGVTPSTIMGIKTRRIWKDNALEILQKEIKEKNE